ncbi:salicylate synthase [Actinacidiphila epipremni]|uniref:Salicylate synthase n=1 Tax=Actinacidiphila epipremni TaxID=2053013 RepID=A0ABX0ZJJ7_9ACTN|nr:salicylate synthase [Actinacidiphila epipremni]NJP43476.1 salicylate synthase [Actinacidiphila epipremni]
MPPRHRYRQTEAAAPHDPLLTVARLAAAHRGEPHVVHEREGTWTFCAGALAELTVDGRHVHYACGTDRRRVAWRDRPLDVLSVLLDDLPVDAWRAYGWAAFELAEALAAQGAGPAPRADADRPLLHLVVPRHEVRITAGRAAVRSVDPDALARLAGDVGRPPGDAEPARAAAEPDLSLDGELYRKAVAAAVAEIADGVMDKVVLSRTVPVPHPVDLVATYVLGRRHNTPARSFLLDTGGLRAAGFSPEVVVSVSADGRVQTQPLAGTRARTGDPAENERLRAELLHHPKEIHEHRISVTAATEELAAVCEPAGIRLEEDMVVKERGSVHHLASRVCGRLAPGLTCWDALAATFPAITVSGVPKPAALAAIHRHEQDPRGLYGGAVLAVDSDGSLDAALVLRTVFEQSGRAWLRAGAGIVGQSRPARELEETCEKLRSVSAHLVPARGRAR